MTSAPATGRQRWVMLALAVSIAAAAVMAPRLQKPTLRIAIHQGVEGVALRKTARAFSEAHDVAVEVFELPYDALYEAEMGAVTAPQPRYDVVMVDDPWLPALIGEDALNSSTRLRRLEFTDQECADLRLEDFVAPTLLVSLHPKHPKALEQTAPGEVTFSCDEIHDALYALPFVGNSQLFVTREGRRPQSWREVQESAADGATDAGYVARVGAGNSIVTDFLPILWTLPGDQTAVSRTGATAGEDAFGLERGPVLEAFGFIHALGAHPRANRSVVSVDDFDLAINIVKGHASMSIAWSAWVMAIAKLPAPHSDELLAIPGPGRLTIGQVPGGEPVLGAWLLAIPAKSRQQELAKEFLTFATSPERLEQAAGMGNPPPRRSTLSDGDLQMVYPFFPEQLRSLSRARPRLRTPLWRDFERVLGECLTTLYENAVSPADAWDRVEAGLAPIRTKDERIRALQAATDYEPGKVRGILDAPLAPFSCLDAGKRP